MAPVGMAANQLGRGLFATCHRRVLKIHIAGLENVKSGNLGDHPILQQFLGQITAVFEVVVQRQDLQELRRANGPAILFRNPLAAQHPLSRQQLLIRGFRGRGRLARADGGAAGGFQDADGLFVHLQGDSVAGGIQAFGGDTIRAPTPRQSRR